MPFDIPMPFGMGLPQMPEQLPQQQDEVLAMVQRALQQQREQESLRNYQRWSGREAPPSAGETAVDFVKEALPTAAFGFAPMAPKVAGAAAGLYGLTTGSTEAGPTDARADEIRSLNQRIADDQKRLEKFATTNFQSKTAREAASQPILDSITKAQNRIAALQGEMDVEAERKRTANTPIKELVPGLGLGLGAAGVLAGGYLGNRIAKSGVDKFNTAINDINTRWGAAAGRARAAPNNAVSSAEARGLQTEFEALQAAGPAGQVAGPLAGAAAGELGLNLPVGIDYARSVAGSELYGKTMDTITDPWQVGGRMLTGALMGGIPGKIGSSLAGRHINQPAGFRAETGALSSRPPPSGPAGPQIGSPAPLPLLSAPLPPAPALPAPKGPSPSSSSDSPARAGKTGTTYHMPNGDFAPKRLWPKDKQSFLPMGFDLG